MKTHGPRWGILGGMGILMAVAVAWAAAAGQAAAAPAPEEAAKEPAEAPRAFLGVILNPLTKDLKAEAKVASGAAVTNVLAGSPAAKAGLEPNDVITEIDGMAVLSPEELVERLHAHKPGDKITVTWSRGGKMRKATATLAAAPYVRTMPMEVRPPQEGPSEAFLGIVLAPLTKEMMDIAGTKQGVLIDSVTDLSPAAKAGLLPGDVITAVDGKAMNTPEELIACIRGHQPGDAVRVTYWRMGKRLEADVPLGERPRTFIKRLEPGEPLPPGEMREYLKRLRPEMEERLREWREEFGEKEAGPPELPEEARPHGPRPSYDVGKDIGRILQRLDEIEDRLDEIEDRLDEIEGQGAPGEE